ncbi:MAG: glycosyltransferase [Bacteroidales bacterium]|nr:glycosyltransferase [Bacteroidales bacterium]
MDGVSVCVQNYAYWLQKHVGKVCVVTPMNYGHKYNEDYTVLEYMSIPVPFRYPYMTGVAEIDPVFMAKLLKRRFKIVHAHSPFASGMAAQRVAKFQNIPMVATFHSKYRQDFEKVIPSKLAVDAIIKKIVSFYESADEVWVPQASVREVLKEYGYKGSAEVVQNGSDLCGDYTEAYFEEARRTLGIAPGQLALLFVGQHVWQKNTKLIIEALSRIKDLDFRMFFIGSGYAEEEMKQMVTQAGLDSKVSFEGIITDRDRIKVYYAAADLFLFPSLYDTDGLVVHEAAALHTPSIMAREATAASMIKEGDNGFLTSNDPDSFADLLRRLAVSREEIKKAGISASQTLVRSWEDIAAEVLDRYNSLIVRQKMI